MASSTKRIQTLGERHASVPPIADIKASTPVVLSKDKVSFPISDLFLHIERPIDFEAIRVNGCDGIKEAFVAQKLTTYLDCLNGPVYPEIVKDFWMKAQVALCDSIPQDESIIQTR
ncbi:hypothetical protein QL285_097983 [Trifolium repens]|nr:hypothetical protein QL285_097983 [Trifolium repens]